MGFASMRRQLSPRPIAYYALLLFVVLVVSLGVFAALVFHDTARLKAQIVRSEEKLARQELGEAIELMTEGRLLDYDQAAGYGLVNHVWDAETFDDELRAYARSFCPPAKASLSAGFIKRAVHGGIDSSIYDGLALERELQQRLFESADAAEGLAAYVEKRKPSFSGK